MTQYSPILAIIVVLGLICDVFSFVPPVQARRALGKSKAAHVTSALGHRRTSKEWVRGYCMEMELELMQKMPNIQGKRLDVVDQEQGVYNYEFTIEAPGSSTQRLNHHITRAVREKSNFPNLKRGQVPPHLVLQTKKFVVEEVMNEGISTALEAYGLVGAGGDETNADIMTDINELVMGFKPGRTLTFSCRIHAKAKPPDSENESSPAADESTSSNSDATTTGDNTRLPDITASTVDDSILVDKTV